MRTHAGNGRPNHARVAEGEERQRQGEETAVEEFERTGKFETAEGGKARDTESVEDKTEASESKKRQAAIELRRRKRDRLTEAICSLLDDFSMVSFLPLNITDEESIDFVLSNVDHTVQYGEDAEVRGADLDDAEIMGNA